MTVRGDDAMIITTPDLATNSSVPALAAEDLGVDSKEGTGGHVELTSSTSTSRAPA
jgi:hypothetical protein